MTLSKLIDNLDWVSAGILNLSEESWTVLSKKSAYNNLNRWNHEKTSKLGERDCLRRSGDLGP